MKKAAFGALAFVAAACIVAAPAGAQTTAGNGPQVYTAKLLPMNAKVAGHKATAEARLTVSGDTLTISIKAQGVPPGMVHWQHFHGFKDNHAASCPTAAADVNHDGIIDLIETEPMSGTTNGGDPRNRVAAMFRTIRMAQDVRTIRPTVRLNKRRANKL